MIRMIADSMLDVANVLNFHNRKESPRGICFIQDHHDSRGRP